MTDDLMNMIQMWEWIQGLDLPQDSKQVLTEFMFRPWPDTED